MPAMSEIQLIGLVVAVGYLIGLFFFRTYFVAQASSRALLGRVREVRATADSLLAADDRRLAALTALERDLAQWSAEVIATGARENQGWSTVHHLERVLVDAYKASDVYAELRREQAELLSKSSARDRRLAVIVGRYLDKNGNVRAGRSLEDAKADLVQLMERRHRASDAYYVTLADLYNRAFWLIVTGLMFVIAIILLDPDLVPVLGAGAVGGLASRIMLIQFSKSIPTDYGAMWAPLFLSPVLGALLAWLGMLLIALGKAIGLFALDAVDLEAMANPAVLAIAALFGYTEGFFNGVAKAVATRVAPASDDEGEAGTGEGKTRAGNEGDGSGDDGGDTDGNGNGDGGKGEAGGTGKGGGAGDGDGDGQGDVGDGEVGQGDEGNGADGADEGDEGKAGEGEGEAGEGGKDGTLGRQTDAFATSVVESLNGAQLLPADESWEGLSGTVVVENVDARPDTIRFEVVLPTSVLDVEDFILSEERESGTTDKVVLMQAGNPVAGAHTVLIDREGPEDRWTQAAVHQYRFTFELPPGSIQGGQPLELHLRSKSSGVWRDVATAKANPAG